MQHHPGSKSTSNTSGTKRGKSKGVYGKISSRDLPWANFPDNPSGLSTVCQTLGFKIEEDAAQSCPIGLSGETVGVELLKSDSVKSRLRWLKNKVWNEDGHSIASDIA